MRSRRTNPLVLLLVAAVGAGCAASPKDGDAAASPTPTRSPAPADLADRVRIRIAGREIPSITSADYFLFFVVLGEDGRREPIRVLATLYMSSGGLALAAGSQVWFTFDQEDWPELDSSRHGPEDLCEDFGLPPGTRLCFEPGTFFAYRIVDEGPTMVADLDPEIWIGQLRADGSGYVELQPSDGPELPRAQDPPDWPPPAR